MSPLRQRRLPLMLMRFMLTESKSGGDSRTNPQWGVLLCCRRGTESSLPVGPARAPGRHQVRKDLSRWPSSAPPASTLVRECCPRGHPVHFSFQSAKQRVPWASGQKIPCVVWVVMVSCLDLHPNSAKFLAKSSFLLYKMVITMAPTSWGFVLRITWNNESQGLSAVFWPI